MDSGKRQRRKRSLIERDGLRCRYCGCPLQYLTATIDHWIPESRGGSDDLSNLVLACKPCNEWKDDLTGDEFRDKFNIPHDSRVYYILQEIRSAKPNKRLGKTRQSRKRRSR